MRWLLAGISCLCLSSIQTQAHERWANGAPVAPAVKSECCGAADAHHLTPDQVHMRADGWHIDGYSHIVPAGEELPSPDGDYWIFYMQYSTGEQTKAYCFFVPLPGM